MADRSNFWKMVNRTKPGKLRVFGDSELRDCLDYFSEIQSDSTVPANEMITASERLTLIRSEIDRRHADAKHGRTQRLASWAIAVGMVSLAVAITSGVAQYLASKTIHDNLPTTITVVTPAPSELPTLTPASAATPSAVMIELTATPNVPAVITPTPIPTPTEQLQKKRLAQSETRRKTDQCGPIEQLFRSLFRPKPTPRSDRR